MNGQVVLIKIHKAQSGWFLFEALFSMMIGFFVLSAATYFFFSSCRVLTQMRDQWHQIEVWEKWRLWMQDALNQTLAYSRCDHTGSVNLRDINHTEYVLHSCRFIDQSWHWIDTRYYVKKKQGVSYLYEKIAGKTGVAWIGFVKNIQAYPISVGIQKKSHLFVIDGIVENVSIPALDTHFVFQWSDDKK